MGLPSFLGLLFLSSLAGVTVAAPASPESFNNLGKSEVRELGTRATKCLQGDVSIWKREFTIELPGVDTKETILKLIQDPAGFSAYVPDNNTPEKDKSVFFTGQNENVYPQTIQWATEMKLNTLHDIFKGKTCDESDEESLKKFTALGPSLLDFKNYQAAFSKYYAMKTTATEATKAYLVFPFHTAQSLGKGDLCGIDANNGYLIPGVFWKDELLILINSKTLEEIIWVDENKLLPVHSKTYDATYAKTGWTTETTKYWTRNTASNAVQVRPPGSATRAS